MDSNYLIQLTNNLYRLTLLFPKKEPLRYKIRELADEILANLILTLETNPIANLTRQNLVKNLEVLDGFFEVAKAQNWVPVLEVLRIQEEYNRIKAEIKKIPRRPPEIARVAELRSSSRRRDGRRNLFLRSSPTEPLDRGARGEKRTKFSANASLRSAVAETSSHLPPRPAQQAGRGSAVEPVPSPEIEKVEAVDVNPQHEPRMPERQEKILVFLREQGRAQVWQIKQILSEVTKRTLRRDFENLLKKGLIERIGERNDTFYQLKRS